MERLTLRGMVEERVSFSGLAILQFVIWGKEFFKE